MKSFWAVSIKCSGAVFGAKIFNLIRLSQLFNRCLHPFRGKRTPRGVGNDFRGFSTNFLNNNPKIMLTILLASLASSALAVLTEAQYQSSALVFCFFFFGARAHFFFRLVLLLLVLPLPFSRLPFSFGFLFSRFRPICQLHASSPKELPT